jgi:gamma-glutamyltranspeptidase/glutathione hydrolase
MVSSVEENATRAGLEILQRGGNAVDAAVAVAFTLAVTHPSAGNIGGGGFLLMQRVAEPAVYVDFRETAPKALTQSAFNAMIRAKARGPAAVGIPGTVAGLSLAHRTQGKLPWAELLAPAIRLSREGHALGKRQALVLGWAWPFLDGSARKIFGPKGRPLRAGETLVQKDLAETLERIQREREQGFYAGVTAARLTGSLAEKGFATTADLESYRAHVREPPRFDYRGFDVTVAAPPSAGGVALTRTLVMLQALGSYEPGSAESLHRLIETARRAHAERRFEVQDPATESRTWKELEARWLNSQSWLEQEPRFDPEHATPSSKVHPLYAKAAKELEHTTHFSVADAEGNVVTCTTTLSASFGAKFVAEGTGVVLNNAVGSFGTAGVNLPAGGKRTVSSMAPTLIASAGRPVALLGSPGGDTIPNTVAQVLTNLIDGKLFLDEAVERARIHHGFVPDVVFYETEYPLPLATRRALEKKGHRLQKRRPIGDANNIVIRYSEQGLMLYGFADPREGGLAQGLDGPRGAPAPTQ